MLDSIKHRNLAKGLTEKALGCPRLICYWCTSELGMTQSELARELGMMVSGIGYAVRRGEAIAAREHIDRLILLIR